MTILEKELSDTEFQTNNLIKECYGGPFSNSCLVFWNFDDVKCGKADERHAMLAFIKATLPSVVDITNFEMFCQRHIT